MSNNISRRWTYAEARAQYANADLNNAIQTTDTNAEMRGVVKGIAQEKLATAKRLKSLGIDIDIIVKGTGLAKEEIIENL